MGYEGKHGEIPQVAHTYRVVGLMNEFQVAIGETTFDGRLDLISPDGLLPYYQLMVITLQRTRTAREAIKVMTDLFEAACQKQRIELFVNPPRRPAMNGGVERLNRTSREEFYEVEDIAIRLDEHNQQLERWNQTYNCVRPHQSLAQKTPDEYYQKWIKQHRANRCHLCTGRVQILDMNPRLGITSFREGRFRVLVYGRESRPVQKSKFLSSEYYPILPLTTGCFSGHH